MRSCAEDLTSAYLPQVDNLIYTADLFENTAGDPNWPTILTGFRSAMHVPVFIQQVGIKKSATDATTLATGVLKQLNTDGSGWTWWTYRDHTTGGAGYAPYYPDASGAWQLDSIWRNMITSFF